MSERLRLAMALALVTILAGGWFWLRDGEPPSPPSQSAELAGAEAALAAWGLWAGDGDLAHLEGTFADGPQLAQIRSEDPTIVPGDPYHFVLSDARVVEPGLVRGTVMLTRPGEVEQHFQWDLELIEVDGVWRLWTVRTSP